MPSASHQQQTGQAAKPCQAWPVSGAGTGVRFGRLPLSSSSKQLPGSFVAASGRFSRPWHGPGGRATREGARRSSNLRGPVKQACKTLAFGGEGGLPGCITAEEIENPVAQFQSFPSLHFACISHASCSQRSPHAVLGRTGHPRDDNAQHTRSTQVQYLPSESHASEPPSGTSPSGLCPQLHQCATPHAGPSDACLRPTQAQHPNTPTFRHSRGRTRPVQQ